MKRVKNLALLLVTGIITISSLVNISTQISTLQNAYRENRKWEEKNELLKTRISELTEQVKYASQPAAINQKAHDLLGIGSGSDYWIVDETGEIQDLFPEIKESARKPIISQWIELFTK